MAKKVVAKRVMPPKKVRYPSTVQVSLPVDIYDAAEKLAAFEGSSLSQLGRRGFIVLLMQAGAYPSKQQQPAKV